MNKATRFSKAFEIFQGKSKLCGGEYEIPDVQDWMQLFVEFNAVIKQGSGLTWSEIQEIIERELK